MSSQKAIQLSLGAVRSLSAGMARLQAASAQGGWQSFDATQHRNTGCCRLLDHFATVPHVQLPRLCAHAGMLSSSGVAQVSVATILPRCLRRERGRLRVDHGSCDFMTTSCRMLILYPCRALSGQ